MLRYKRPHLSGQLAAVFLIVILVFAIAGSTGAAPSADTVLVPSADVYVDEVSAVNTNGTTRTLPTLFRQESISRLRLSF